MLLILLSLCSIDFRITSFSFYLYSTLLDNLSLTSAYTYLASWILTIFNMLGFVFWKIFSLGCIYIALRMLSKPFLSSSKEDDLFESDIWAFLKNICDTLSSHNCPASSKTLFAKLKWLSLIYAAAIFK